MKLVKSILKILLKIMYIFPIDNKKVYILSFGGKSTYGFDGRALIEYSNKQKLNYKFIWGINKKENAINTVENVKCSKVKTMVDIYHLITCGIFITNINPPSYIPFRKRQVLINTWHGYPMKIFGKYDPTYNLKQVNTSNCFISHSKQYTDYALKDAFEFKGDILNCGAPRNDVFFNKEEMNERKKYIKEKYNIGEKKILLYAPTFRGDFNDSNSNLDYRKIVDILKEKTKEDWIVMKRLHPLISNKSIVENTDITVDVSDYPDMQDILCSADILVTDYSSTSWDFSILRKPVLIYAYDYDEYIKNRGLNILALNRPYPIASTEEELISVMKDFDMKKYLNALDDYFNKVEKYDNGKACYEIFSYIVKKQSEK